MSKLRKPSDIPTNRGPCHGIFYLLPCSWVPYAELTRVHKPTGVLVVYLPYLFGLLFAGLISSPPASPLSLMYGAATLLLASFVLRSAGCTWNDVVDYNLDQLTTRCRLRPIARGAVSPVGGSIFYAAQMALWLIILWFISLETLLSVGVVILMTLLYPYAKRYTDYPQLVLGVTLASGLGPGSKVLGISILTLYADDPRAGAGLGFLFVAYVLWTAIFDTIYGFQDLQDDRKSGVRSMSVRWQNMGKELLTSLAILVVGSLAVTGRNIEASLGYYLGACGGSAAALGAMIYKIDLEDTTDCAWWFMYGTLVVGGCMSEGLMAEYVSRIFASDMIQK